MEQGARVLDLEQYRRRRAARRASASGVAVPYVPFVWVPVLVWLPLWPV